MKIESPHANERILTPPVLSREPHAWLGSIPTANGQTHEEGHLHKEDRRPETADSTLGLKLAQASALSFFIYVGGAGLTGLAQLIVAHMIGPSSYGIYSYVLAWTTLLSYVATLGFPTVMLRYIPAYGATGEWSLAHGVIRFAFIRSSIVAVLLAAVGVSTVLYLAPSLERELTVSMCIGLATVPLTTAYLVGSAAVRAFGGVISAVAPERLGRDGFMMMLLLLIVLFHAGTIDASIVMTVLFLSSAAVAGIVWLSMIKLWPTPIRSASPAYSSPDWWLLAVPVMGLIAVETIMNRAGVMLMGWWGYIEEAGLFALGLNLALFTILPRAAVGTFFAPNVSKLYAQRNQVALQRLFTRACLLSLAGTTALAVPLLVLTDPLLRLFGKEFAATGPIVQMLVIGQIFAAAAGPQLNVLTMTGYERAAALITLMGAITCIITCAIGFTFFGIFGAAAATTATNVLWSIAMGFCIYMRLGLMPGLFAAITEFQPVTGVVASARRSPVGRHRR